MTISLFTVQQELLLMGEDKAKVSENFLRISSAFLNIDEPGFTKLKGGGNSGANLTFYANI